MTANGRALLLLAVLALLPFGRVSEVPLLIGALLGVQALWQHRIDFKDAMVRLAGCLFLGYWLPELLSAVDAVNPGKAWTEVAADLRYLPFLLFALQAVRTTGQRRVVLHGAALILLLWLVDALLQAVTGWSIGGPVEADRLSGIFGADLKLGGVVAVLSPLLLWPALQHSRWLGGLAFVVVLTVVLLAGARAAWLSLAVVATLLLWSALPRRQALAGITLAAGLAIVGLWAGSAGSDQLAARLARSQAALAGDHAALDHALSFRLPIWQAGWSMFRAHPINGVGVRGFRYAYAEHVPADDRWRDFNGDQGAFHAHQWVLEVLAETGLLGLACWCAALLIGWRRWRSTALPQRRQALPLSIALIAMLFPLNTHYAFYSSVWGGLLFWLLAIWLALLKEPAEPTEPVAAAPD